MNSELQQKSNEKGLRVKKIKIGISGAGSFSESFIPLFKVHPYVKSVAIAEVFPERRRRIASKFEIEDTYESHEMMCESDIDAIALFTQRHLHGPQAISALKKGKHVYSAVPAFSAVDEGEEIVKLVEETGLTYMMGETSYYYPSALFCRNKFKKGEFGSFVYGEGEYYHDMSHGFYDAYKFSGGDQWKRVAGIPPMYYPTHSTSMIVSITGAFMTQVSCLGYVDKHDDSVYGFGNNLWDNPFSNQTALFRTSNGGMCRINEFRRIGHGVGNNVRTSIYGTLGCFEEQSDSAIWTTLDKNIENVNDLLECQKANYKVDLAGTGKQSDFFSGVSKVHPVERLPETFTGLKNGHNGSHQFLVDDFLRAVIQSKLAPNHVWAAARYTIPGILAHESAKKDGEMLNIPDFGAPSSNCGYISYD